LAARRKAGTTHGKAAPDHLRSVLRAATREEIARGAQLRADEDNVRKRALEKVRAQGLEMKVSDSEWQWDKKKLTIYFTAEKRVDFRELVRQLEGLFGTRVQMWHIGVRDEARRLDGVGRCARQYCSASWLPELRPVKSSTAKDQRLSTLNPAQISGSCGRLMCCLRYEHEFYVQQRRRFPKEGKVLLTALGEEKVIANDIFREQVTLRTLTGDTRVLLLAALHKELGADALSTTAEHRVELETEDDGEGEEQAEPKVLITIERAQPHVEGAAPLARWVEPAPLDVVVPGAQKLAAAPEAVQTNAGQPGAGPTGNREGRRRRRGRRGGRRGRGGGPGSQPAS
ncbi:MAG TPA: regulatory iron-sulfur-containing complex subunit RicT, partial [Gemmatimonadaceae bacterium]|nr:regulatory iron-sulfur-containing complex subunit RicT [Gemmatimonadaceae bacterium]